MKRYSSQLILLYRYD